MLDYQLNRHERLVRLHNFEGIYILNFLLTQN